ncbi:TolB family protein [Siansivirga zeaxanthinifaciens]|uniref:WD40 repeat protein n=1 Tax=Siansivirga zeaxanthinifaciens CC-SAMT-1 TaxID=1454006 RepID=A0A0C5WCT8_9FLAO|nr:PD40 domain-containing protein [Siansivirga zeaxanthinifaciens]AJR04853.1 hypothetical protein AW14_07390 [Siansivirga zeaxanthinifaciens CC-SAMT-1]
MLKFLLCSTLLITSLSYAQSDLEKAVNLELNNEYPHFGLMVFESNKVLFTSYLIDKRGKLERQSGAPVLGVYEGALSSNGTISNVNLLQIDEAIQKNGITSAALSPNGEQLFITMRYSSKDMPKGTFNPDNFHIRVGEYVSEVGWTNFTVLPFCDPKYSYAHPAFSKDGKTMYFTSNIRGGKETTKGGSDIFKVDVLDNNTFSEPKNMGPNVNSYSKEMFPFVSHSGDLYLASNRPNGFGGFDIYKCKNNNKGGFGKAEKLPKPINSAQDDFGFIILNDEKTCFFTSKRTDGKGDDDIYKFIIN